MSSKADGDVISADISNMRPSQHKERTAKPDWIDYWSFIEKRLMIKIKL